MRKDWTKVGTAPQTAVPYARNRYRRDRSRSAAVRAAGTDPLPAAGETGAWAGTRYRPIGWYRRARSGGRRSHPGR